MRPYDSLRQRLVQPFLLLGFIVSSALSLITFALLAQIEERAIARTLQVEMDSFRYRLANNPAALPAQSSLLHGYFLPDPRLPKYPEVAGSDQILEIRNVSDSEYSILFSRVADRPFALLYDRSYIKSNLQYVALLLLIATAVMTLVSFLVGYRLSRRVIAPILRLVRDVSRKAQLRNFSMERFGFSDADYPRDEIGDLVQALDRFSDRLYAFVQRESYFAADVSHELRTPVAVILGATEVLSEVPALPEAARRRIATIQRSAARMSQLLEAMLILAKEERIDSDPSCNLDEVVREAVTDSLPTLEGRPVRIDCDIAQRVSLPIERSLAYVLVSNVLRNACAYTREGVIAISLTPARLAISDTGIGIPEDRYQEMFQRHRKGEGSSGHGLGLSIVARICERLNWTISVNSSSNEGTEFTFVFPQ